MSQKVYGPRTEAESHILDMRLIRDRVRARGVPCVVEQTGGGCATLYAGRPAVSVMWPDDPAYYPVAAGPGTYYPVPEADDREFSAGLTLPDGDVFDSFVAEGLSEAQWADVIVKLHDGVRADMIVPGDCNV